MLQYTYRVTVSAHAEVTVFASNEDDAWSEFEDIKSELTSEDFIIGRGAISDAEIEQLEGVEDDG